MSLDFKIDVNKKKIQNFFNNLIYEENLRVNLSKDLTTKKKTISHLKDYINFSRDIKKYNKNSLFSKRIFLSK